MAERRVIVPLTVEDSDEIVGVVLIRRTVRGTLLASGWPVEGNEMPGQTPEVLRWLADAYELHMLQVTDD